MDIHSSMVMIGDDGKIEKKHPFGVLLSCFWRVSFDYLLLFADVACNMKHHEIFDYLLLNADVSCNVKHHDTLFLFFYFLLMLLAT